MASLRTTPDSDLPAAQPRAMTRCECAGISFEEIGRRVHRGEETPEQVRQRTGCGNTCTACLPDLLAYLRSR